VHHAAKGPVLRNKPRIVARGLRNTTLDKWGVIITDAINREIAPLPPIAAPEPKYLQRVLELLKFLKITKSSHIVGLEAPLPLTFLGAVVQKATVEALYSQESWTRAGIAATVVTQTLLETEHIPNSLYWPERSIPNEIASADLSVVHGALVVKNGLQWLAQLAGNIKVGARLFICGYNLDHAPPVGGVFASGQWERIIVTVPGFKKDLLFEYRAGPSTQVAPSFPSQTKGKFVVITGGRKPGVVARTFLRQAA